MVAEFESVVEYVKYKCGELGGGFRESACELAAGLEKFAAGLIGGYKLGSIKDTDPTKAWSGLAEKFNEQASAVKRAIESLRLEQAEAEDAVRQIGLLHGVIENRLRGGEIRGSTEEFMKLASELAAAGAKKIGRNDVDGIRRLLFAARLALKLEGIADLFSNPAGAGKIIKFPAFKKASAAGARRGRDAESLRCEIAYFHELTDKIDPAVARGLDAIAKGAETEDNLQRLALVRDEMRLRYAGVKKAAAESEAFRNDLAQFRQLAAEYEGHQKVVEAIDAALARKCIGIFEYTSLKEEFNGFVSEQRNARRARASAAEFIRRLAESLETLGYRVDKASEGEDGNGKICEVDFPSEGYRASISASFDGSLGARAERLLDDGRGADDISDARLSKDRDVAEKWCSDLAAAAEKLREQGIVIDIEPEKPPSEGVALVRRGGRRPRGNIFNIEKRLGKK